MAWQWIALGEINWNGAEYVVRDMGGGGDCLFRSLAMVFAMAGKPPKSHTDLRAGAVQTIIEWVLDLPDWFDDQHYETPTEARVGAMVSGDWGDMTSILAVLDYDYDDFAVVILNASDKSVLTDEEYLVDVVASGAVVATTVLIMWLGGNHYVAVIPKTQAGGIGAMSASLVDLEPKDTGVPVSAKLSTVSGLSTSMNTKNDSDRTLEIHQINVGVGDAALILVHEKGKYVQSILVDSGQFPDAVTGYFDYLISLKRFRPVDIFVASHYDADHIGAAPAVLGNAKYVSGSLILFDPGVPTFSDSDYQSYLKAFGEPNTGKRKVADLESPIYTAGQLTVQIVAMNGLYRGAKKGEYETTIEAYSDEPVSKKLVSGEGTKYDWSEAGLTPLALFPPDKNDCSLAVLVQFHHFRYFTAGDLNGHHEDTIVRHIFSHYLASSHHVCACKLNHHGAHEATSASVLKMLRPRVCLVSCGTPNVHGHPSAITLTRVDQLGAVYPCNSLITADLSVKATEGGFPWARPADNSRHLHAQGSIVLIAPEKIVSGAKHGFIVMTTANAEETLYLCGERPYNKDLPIVESKSKHSLSDQQKEEKKKRRRSRKDDIQKSAEEAGQQLRLEVIAELSRVAGELIINPDFHAQVIEVIKAKADGIARKLIHQDSTEQEKKLRTFVKNFGKNLPDCKSRGDVEKII